MRRPRLLVILAAGLLVASTPTIATSDSKYTTGCTSGTSSALHASVTRSRYSTSGTGTAIYASATQSYKQVRTLQPDINWTFHHFESAGLQTRYSQPTQWGSPGNPLNSVTRWVDTYWHGVNYAGGTYTALCRTTIGP